MPLGIEYFTVPSTPLRLTPKLTVVGLMTVTPVTLPTLTSSCDAVIEAVKSGSLNTKVIDVGGVDTVEPFAGVTEVTAVTIGSKKNEPDQAVIPWLSLLLVIAPAAIAIVCDPCAVTGLDVNENRIVLASTSTNELAGMAFTVKSEADTLLGA